MTTPLYSIFLVGGTGEPTAVAGSLAALFKTTPEKVKVLLASGRHKLKSGLDAGQASLYKRTIEAAGGKVEVVEEKPIPQTLDVDLGPADFSFTAPPPAPSPQENVRLTTAARQPTSATSRPSFAISQLLSLVILACVVLALYFLASAIFPSLRSPAQIDWQSFVGAPGPKTLYQFWQAKNPPESGQYQDQLVDGQVLFHCKVSGGHDGYFGFLVIKTTFSMFAIKDPKSFTVFITGIDWGDRIQTAIQPVESGGVGAIGALQLAGCEVPKSVADEAARIAGISSIEPAPASSPPPAPTSPPQLPSPPSPVGPMSVHPLDPSAYPTIVREYEKLHRTCQDGTDLNHDQIVAVCKKRDEMFDEVNRAGFCFGPDDAVESDKEWYVCSENPGAFGDQASKSRVRAPSTATQALAPISKRAAVAPSIRPTPPVGLRPEVTPNAPLQAMATPTRTARAACPNAILVQRSAAYPARAMKSGIESGSVTAHFRVSPNGEVTDITLSSSSKLFDDTVLGMVKQLQCPGNGQDQLITWQVDFKTEE